MNSPAERKKRKGEINPAKTEKDRNPERKKENSKQAVQAAAARQTSQQPRHQPTAAAALPPIIRVVAAGRRGALLVVHALLGRRASVLLLATPLAIGRGRAVARALLVRVRRAVAAVVVALRRRRALVVVADLAAGRTVGRLAGRRAAVGGWAGVVVHGSGVGGGCAGGREVLLGGWLVIWWFVGRVVMYEGGKKSEGRGERGGRCDDGTFWGRWRKTYLFLGCHCVAGRDLKGVVVDGVWEEEGSSGGRDGFGFVPFLSDFVSEIPSLVFLMCGFEEIGG